MATNTTNLGLVKPALDDFYDVGVFNKNMDAIDTAIQDLRDDVAGTGAGNIPSAEKQKEWDDKPTTEQAQAMASAAETNAKNDSIPRTTVTTTGDWNNYKTTGFYDGTGLANAPEGSGGWWYVEVVAHSLNSAQWCTQLASDFNSSTFYKRTLSNGVWSAWVRVLNQNDYNTLFQSVSNGKAALATVIGGVATTASFEEMKNKIVQDKQAAINSLTQKGVQVSPDATLEQILASISQVGGTAEGRIMLDQTGRATITGLGFTPKLIHVRGSYNLTSYYSFMADPTQVSHRFLYISSYPYDQYNFQVELVTGDVINNIVNGGFSVNFNSRLTNREIEWKASG